MQRLFLWCRVQGARASERGDTRVFRSKLARAPSTDRDGLTDFGNTMISTITSFLLRLKVYRLEMIAHDGPKDTLAHSFE